jgi:hypothetical protein
MGCRWEACAALAGLLVLTCEIRRPDDMGPAAQELLVLRPLSLLFYLEPTLDDGFPPILPPWPGPITIEKSCLGVDFYLRVEFMKLKRMS